MILYKQISFQLAVLYKSGEITEEQIKELFKRHIEIIKDFNKKDNHDSNKKNTYNSNYKPNDKKKHIPYREISKIIKIQIMNDYKSTNKNGSLKYLYNEILSKYNLGSHTLNKIVEEDGCKKRRIQEKKSYKKKTKPPRQTYI